ncbi:MAG: response regulator, partial [Gammaproteobacteria bacterium]|nr:response regulator [Gammaproteobacteria bacterium]
FFTTKEVGKGTGMGLSVVYGIMENNGGHILIESEPGTGTSMRLLFPPILEEVSSIVDTGSDTSDVSAANSENILIVDDEESNVLLMNEMLNSFGYQSTITTDSTEALTMFKENPDKFSMLITDQTMPKMTGLQLIEKIQQIKPDLPVILSSGFSDKIAAEETENNNIHYIKKPVDFGKLNNKIAQLLSSGED